MINRRLTINEYREGILAGDRIVLARAITLTESILPQDHQTASRLIAELMPHAGSAIRIGITGAPGVGKSTFIEAFGRMLTAQQTRVAVLTIDPSSQITGGSILGDKTRMPELSKDPRAFVRPSSSGSVLGGVAGRTREAILLCEAAGFEVIIIETVGVGQSEVVVTDMVDFFLLLMLAGAGDELQGIKKGIMEMADAVVITKADGDNVGRATEAQADFQHAMHLLQSKASGWIPKVLTSSARDNTGIDEVWKVIRQFHEKTNASGYFRRNREAQRVRWFHDHFRQRLLTDHLQYGEVEQEARRLDDEILKNGLSPYDAANRLLEIYHRAIADQARLRKS